MVLPQLPEAKPVPSIGQALYVEISFMGTTVQLIGSAP